MRRFVRAAIDATRGLRLSSLLSLVAFSALALGYADLARRMGRQEERLREEIRAERTRAQGYQRLARLALERGSSSNPAVSTLIAEYVDETERFAQQARKLRAVKKEGSR